MTKILASTSAEGTMIFMRHDDDKPKECVCCGGQHIFSRSVQLADLVDYWGRPVTRPNEFVDDFACQKGPDKEPIYEGKRVRITVEILDDGGRNT